jgi:hypothetical protein
MKDGIRSSIKYLAGRRAGCDDVAPSGRKARRWPWFARITSGMPRMANGIRSTSSAICETAVRPGRRIGHAIWTRSGRSAITPPRLSPRLCRPMRTLSAPAPPPTYNGCRAPPRSRSSRQQTKEGAPFPLSHHNLTYYCLQDCVQPEVVV